VQLAEELRLLRMSRALFRLVALQFAQAVGAVGFGFLAKSPSAFGSDSQFPLAAGAQ
jgi:hypothetical protein